VSTPHTIRSSNRVDIQHLNTGELFWPPSRAVDLHFNLRD
jgi:hypothetical protein